MPEPSRQPSRRALFVAGKLTPRRKVKKVCAPGAHVGPLLRTEVYDAVEGWNNMGDCRACGSTIHRSQLARVA